MGQGSKVERAKSIKGSERGACQICGPGSSKLHDELLLVSQKVVHEYELDLFKLLGKATDGSWKVHWFGWDKMLVSKRDGGIGFHDFEAFNQALLAKQGWRELTNLESLCVLVLRGRYYNMGHVCWCFK